MQVIECRHWTQIERLFKIICGFTWRSWNNRAQKLEIYKKKLNWAAIWFEHTTTTTITTQQKVLKMSVSSPEVSLSSSSTTSSAKDDVDYWEVNPAPTPSSLSRLSSMDCWDYSIELDCLKGPEGLTLVLIYLPRICEKHRHWNKTLLSAFAEFGLNLKMFNVIK